MERDLTPEVLIGGPEKREIRIVEYDPEWPSRFEVHAGRIREALGEAALGIEHIGSTAVPGLAAKPIIDMLLLVEDSAAESEYGPALEAAGYILRVREPDFHEHRMFRTPQRDVHIHVVSTGCPEIDRWLSFRDHLRSNTAARLSYESLKRALATRDWPDMNDYANAKSEMIEKMIAAARR